MFTQGLKHGVYVIAITLVAVAISLSLEHRRISEALVGATVIVSWLVVGYFFKKDHGSLFSIILESKKVKGLWHYLLGAGVIWGPAKLFISEFPIPDINPFINFVLVILSVPLAGMSVIGVLIFGGMFYRVKA